MGRSRWILALFVLLALGAIAWILGLPQRLLGPSSADPNAQGESVAPDLVAPPGAEGAAPPPEAVTLAGRRIERRGVGSLRARIADLKEVPLAGASVHVQGTGHGGEEVRLQVVSTGEGLVDLTSVPAGVGYLLRVEAPGLPPLQVPDLEVRAGRALDLGTLLVGARATLKGIVLDEAGRPVARADVRALVGYDSLADLMGNFVEMFTRLGREPTAVAQVASAADGTFQLTELPAGPLVVRGQAPGRRAGFARVRMAADGPAEGNVTLVLEKGVPFSGLVVEAAGAPVPGATVALLVEEGGGGMSSNEDESPFDFFSRRVFATTDAKGAFAFVVAPEAKRLRVVVEAAGFPTAMSAVGSAGATDLRVVLARGATLEVAVVDDATGKPLEGVQVVAAVSPGGGFASDTAGGGILYGVTDASGLVALPTGPGQVEMLMASREGYTPLMHSRPQQEAMAAMGAAGQAPPADVPKAIEASGVVRATVRLKSGVRFVGQVLDVAGTPIAGAEVKPLAFMGGGGAGVRTDAEGQFVLEGLSGMMAGQAMAMVRISAPGYVPASETVSIDAGALAAGEVRRDVRLVRAATLRGLVLDPDGHPVAGARVRHTAPPSGGFDFQALLGKSGVLTDARGAFVLTEVPPAPEGAETEAAASTNREDGPAPPVGPPDLSKVRVLVTADGFVPARTEALRFGAGAQVELPPIRLTRGVVARGTVRRPGGGTAAGARVEARLEPEGGPGDMIEMLGALSGAGGLKTTRAGADGGFEFGGLAPGKLTLVARLEGFAPSRRVVAVTKQPLTADLVLRPGADVAGRVLDPEGKPLTGAAVSIEAVPTEGESEDAWVEAVSVRTDAEGRFVLKALPPGPVPLRVAAPGHQRQRLTGLPGGAPLEVRLAVRAGTRSREAIQQEVQQVSRQFATASADERAALQQRLQELMEELQESSGD